VNPRARRWFQTRLEKLEKRRESALMIRTGDPLADRFASFGQGSWIVFPRVLLQNPGAVVIGDDVEIRSYLCIEGYGPPGKILLTIGSGSIIGHFVRFVAVNGIELAERVGIGHNCTITDSTHDWQSAAEGTPPWDTPLAVGEPLRIETGAWIGNNSVISGGLTIGARAIVAPNSVVTRSIPADTLVSGNPARRVPFPRAQKEPDSPE
jgi:acetyltransferase-like isoleucine patch superfamily enzyme